MCFVGWGEGGPFYPHLPHVLSHSLPHLVFHSFLIQECDQKTEREGVCVSKIGWGWGVAVGRHCAISMHGGIALRCANHSD